MPARGIQLKNKLLMVTILCGVVLVGILVAVCGIGLSMGFKKMSIVGFFGALAILALLRIIGWYSSTPR